MPPDAVRLEQFFLLRAGLFLFLAGFGGGRFRYARLGFRRFLLCRLLRGGRRRFGLRWLSLFLFARGFLLGGLLRRLRFAAAEDVVPVVGELLR